MPDLAIIGYNPAGASAYGPVGFTVSANVRKLPADVAAAVARVGEFLAEINPDLFVGDHTHEELSPGAWSIAYEGWPGDTPWPILAAEDLRGSAAGEGWHVEPLTSWALGIFPE